MRQNSLVHDRRAFFRHSLKASSRDIANVLIDLIQAHYNLFLSLKVLLIKLLSQLDHLSFLIVSENLVLCDNLFT